MTDVIPNDALDDRHAFVGMTDRPIIFSGPMVRAILEGRKTMTRRVLKPQPNAGPNGEMVHLGGTGWGLLDGDLSGLWNLHEVGTRLWARENLALAFWPCKATYAADDTPVLYRDHKLFERNYPRISIPSIHMPRWASRITLVVTGVKVERSQDISEEDAIAEGVRPSYPLTANDTAKKEFADLWQSLNAKRAPWESNPFVIAISFKTYRCNIDQMGNS